MTETSVTPPANAPAPRAVRNGADDPHWWRHAVTYQLYIRSFADSSDDGLGDVEGIRSRLPYLASLGVDAVWINPWYPSPQADGGYDVADYRNIDPAFGNLATAEKLINEAHEHGLRVLLDVVPNHTSDEHPWFQAALAAGPGSAERERYIFRPGKGPDGDQPPNDWPAVFGGSAWERVTERDGTPGEWYLHLFDPKQPDLNWEHPEVRSEFEDILRFWFDRGADGFRIDVAHGLIKDPALPDLEHSRPADMSLLDAVSWVGHPYWDRDGVHEVYRQWRAVADSYDPPRVFVGEAWVSSPDRLAKYLAGDELHTAFDFDFIVSAWNAESLRERATRSLASHDAVGAPVMWVLSNHDVTRHVTRLGRVDAHLNPATLHNTDSAPSNIHLGRRRARAALMLELALPGGVYLYQGEELGLEEVTDLPDELLQDPTWERSGHTERGRDGCRVPLPWTMDGPSLGFGSGGSWLPQPHRWGGPRGLSVQAQENDPASMLSFYREALRCRRELPALHADGGSSLTWLDLGKDVVAFERNGGLVCVVNTGDTAVPLPAGSVLLTSHDLDGGALPGDAAAWIQV